MQVFWRTEDLRPSVCGSSSVPVHPGVCELWWTPALNLLSLQTLLDIFTGVKLHLPDTVQDFEKLRRYFLAYDGDLVPGYDAAAATHTLAEPQEDSRAQKVSSDWIWECIRKRRVVPPC